MKTSTQDQQASPEQIAHMQLAEQQAKDLKHGLKKIKLKKEEQANSTREEKEMEEIKNQMNNF